MRWIAAGAGIWVVRQSRRAGMRISGGEGAVGGGACSARGEARATYGWVLARGMAAQAKAVRASKVPIGSALLSFTLYIICMNDHMYHYHLEATTISGPAGACGPDKRRGGVSSPKLGADEDADRAKSPASMMT